MSYGHVHFLLEFPFGGGVHAAWADTQSFLWHRRTTQLRQSHTLFIDEVGQTSPHQSNSISQSVSRKQHFITTSSRSLCCLHDNSFGKHSSHFLLMVTICCNDGS